MPYDGDVHSPGVGRVLNTEDHIPDGFDDDRSDGKRTVPMTDEKEDDPMIHNTIYMSDITTTRDPLFPFDIYRYLQYTTKKNHVLVSVKLETVS